MKWIGVLILCLVGFGIYAEWSSWRWSVDGDRANQRYNEKVRQEIEARRLKQDEARRQVNEHVGKLRRDALERDALERRQNS